MTPRNPGAQKSGFAPKFFLGIKRFLKPTLMTTEIRWETYVSTLGLKILVLDLSIIYIYKEED